MMIHIIFIIEALAAATFLWLGLFITTRDKPETTSLKHYLKRPSNLASGALILMAIFLSGVAINSPASNNEEFLFWLHATWWAIPIAVALWFWCAVLLAASERNTELYIQEKLFVFLFLLYGLICGVVGTTSDYFFLDSQVTSTANIYNIAPSWPGYHVYRFFVISASWAAVVVLLSSYIRYTRSKEGLRRQAFIIRWFIVGGIFLAGAATLRLFLFVAFPQQFADFLITVGLALIGYSVARYNALIQRHILTQDFIFSGVRAITLATSYYTVLQLKRLTLEPDPSNFDSVAIVHLGVITSMFFELVSAVLEKQFLPNWLVKWRTGLRELEDAILIEQDRQKVVEDALDHFTFVIQPEAQKEALKEIIKKEVSSIFSHSAFHNDDMMANSQLHNLVLVKQEVKRFLGGRQSMVDTIPAQHKARALRDFFKIFICKKFCPRPTKGEWEWPQELPVNHLERKEWIESLIFLMQYVENHKRAKVQSYAIEKWGEPLADGGTYSRYQKSGRKRMVALIWQEESRQRSE